MAEQPEFRPPNFTIQEASQYKADIDSSVALLGRIGAAFAPHQKPEIAEVSEVITVADVSGNLDGTYFTISSPATDFYIWLNATDISGLLDPGLSGSTGVQVDFTSDDSAETIASAINTAVDALAELNSSVSGDVVTISSRDEGDVVDDIADGASGGATDFSFAVLVQGGDGPDGLDVFIDAGFVLNDAELSGNNGIEDIAAQTILEGSGSILAPSSNPRIDRIVIDIETGVAELVSGSEDVSPVIPDLPDGKAPNCRFQLETSTTIITNSLIKDERVILEYGNVIQPSFKVGKNTNQNVSDANETQVTWETEIFDNTNSFGSNIFTAPISGKYLFIFSVVCNNITAGDDFQVAIRKDGTQISLELISVPSSGQFSKNLSVIEDVIAGEEFDCTVNSSVDTSYVVNQTAVAVGTAFSGILLNRE